MTPLEAALDRFEGRVLDALADLRETLLAPDAMLFTEESIAAIEPREKGDRQVFEPGGSGLGVRVSKTARAYIVKIRLPHGRLYRETLGPCFGMSLPDARAIVQKLRFDMKSGVDLEAQRAARRTDATLKLGDLVERWRKERLGEFPRLQQASLP
jgi:hypothetical protein